MKVTNIKYKALNHDNNLQYYIADVDVELFNKTSKHCKFIFYIDVNDIDKSTTAKDIANIHTSFCERLINNSSNEQDTLTAFNQTLLEYDYHTYVKLLSKEEQERVALRQYLQLEESIQALSSEYTDDDGSLADFLIDSIRLPQKAFTSDLEDYNEFIINYPNFYVTCFEDVLSNTIYIYYGGDKEETELDVETALAKYKIKI